MEATTPAGTAVVRGARCSPQRRVHAGPPPPDAALSPRADDAGRAAGGQGRAGVAGAASSSAVRRGVAAAAERGRAEPGGRGRRPFPAAQPAEVPIPGSAPPRPPRFAPKPRRALPGWGTWWACREGRSRSCAGRAGETEAAQNKRDSPRVLARGGTSSWLCQRGSPPWVSAPTREATSAGVLVSGKTKRTACFCAPSERRTAVSRGGSAESGRPSNTCEETPPPLPASCAANWHPENPRAQRCIQAPQASREWGIQKGSVRGFQGGLRVNQGFPSRLRTTTGASRLRSMIASGSRSNSSRVKQGGGGVSSSAICGMLAGPGGLSIDKPPGPLTRSLSTAGSSSSLAVRTSRGPRRACAEGRGRVDSARRW